MAITLMHPNQFYCSYILRSIVMLACTTMLISCGGKNTTKPVSKTTPASTSAPAAKPGSGGYYLDDGPGENPPANLDSIPDAVLKTETPLPRANKPYTALGQRYVPMQRYAPYKKQGVASWYGKRYHGKKTSSGEVYDMYGMSAAHPTLPLPSYARVTNPVNGRSVIVRINDRGPFKHDRLIDLSYAAAYKLRLSGQGSGWVEVEAIDTSPQALQDQSNGTNSSPAASQRADNAIATSEMNSEVQVNPTAPPMETAYTDTKSTTRASNQAGNNLTPGGPQYYVQVGAFRSEANGDLLQKKIQGLELAENVGLANVYNNGLYRVRLGPYTNKSEADASAAQIRKRLNISAIVQLQ